MQTAPGHDIISTLPPRRYLQSYKEEKGFRSLASIAKWNNNYGTMTGTSQATAFATGLIALVKTRFPRWSMELIINQVTKTGYGQGTEKIKKATNQGKKLDAYKALTMRDQKINTIVDEPIPNPNDPEFKTRTEEEQKDYESNNPEKGTNFKILGNILKDMKNISDKKK